MYFRLRINYKLTKRKTQKNIYIYSKVNNAERIQYMYVYAMHRNKAIHSLEKPARNGKNIDWKEENIIYNNKITKRLNDF